MANIRLVDKDGNFTVTSIDRERLDRMQDSSLEDKIRGHAHVLIFNRHGYPLMQKRTKNRVLAPNAEVPLHGGHVIEADIYTYEENPNGHCTHMRGRFARTFL